MNLYTLILGLTLALTLSNPMVYAAGGFGETSEGHGMGGEACPSCWNGMTTDTSPPHLGNTTSGSMSNMPALPSMTGPQAPQQSLQLQLETEQTEAKTESQLLNEQQQVEQSIIQNIH
jgi:hypothetical protein